MSKLLNEKIVIDKKKYNYLRLGICLSIAVGLNMLIAIFNLMNKPVERVVVPKVEIKYKQSFVPTHVELGSEDFKELDCLSLNIYHEARGEATVGKLMVGHVTRNRVNHKRFPDSYCDVVYQRKNKVSQFSWVEDGLSDVPKEKDAWYLSQKIAYSIMYGELEDITDGALFYHKNDKNTKFSSTHYDKIKSVAVVGRHITFKLKGE